jgi:ribonuclease P protein component
MLSKKNRIPREMLSVVQKQRSSGNSLHFILLVGGGEKAPRFSVSVSKKVSKSAVVRNAIRRRVYTVLQSFVSVVSPNLYLIRAKSGAEGAKGEKLSQEIFSLLKTYKRG